MSKELNEKINKAYIRILQEESYEEFFNKKLKEYGVKSPAELDDEKKKEFFNMIEKEWTGEKVEEQTFSCECGNSMKSAWKDKAKCKECGAQMAIKGH